MKEIEINFKIKSWNGRPKITSTEKTQVDPDDLIVKIKGDNISEIVSSVLDYVYESHRPFHEGYAAVQSGKLWGFIDTSLTEKVSPIYSTVDNVNEGYALVRKRGKYGF